MLIVETAVVVGMLCASTKRVRAFEEMTPQYIIGNGLSIIPFQAPSGRTLERKMTSEIEEMPGVMSVNVKRTGDAFDVFVMMRDMDFDAFSGVVQKELELDSRFPAYTFNFELLPAAALEGHSGALLSDAA